jgi:hypothetical protein
MEQNVFNKSTERLIQVFLEEEAKSYPHRYCEDFDFLYKKYGREIPFHLLQLNTNGMEWVYKLFNIIIDEIKKQENVGFNKYIFNSLGNTGCVVSSLQVDGIGEFFNWQNKNCFITLCTCGNLNHWGYISYEAEFIADLTAERE